jgi:hypothetical protein
MQIAQYLRLRYPNVIYRYDLAADLKLSIGQAKKHKALQHYRGYPDLFLAEPRGKYHGLFIEIKKDGTRIFTKKGLLVADEHIREQFDMLADLRQRGYQAQFGIGFDNVKQLIDEYLGA